MWPAVEAVGRLSTATTKDREDWLDVLGDVRGRFNWRCHAYCQKSNHYQFLVEMPEGSLSNDSDQGE